MLASRAASSNRGVERAEIGRAGQEPLHRAARPPSRRTGTGRARPARPVRGPPPRPAAGSGRSRTRKRPRCRRRVGTVALPPAAAGSPDRLDLRALSGTGAPAASSASRCRTSRRSAGGRAASRDRSTAGGEPPAPATRSASSTASLQHLLPRLAASAAVARMFCVGGGMDLPQRRQDLVPQPVAGQRSIAVGLVLAPGQACLHAVRARLRARHAPAAGGRAGRGAGACRAGRGARARRQAGRGPSRPGRSPCARSRSRPARAWHERAPRRRSEPAVPAASRLPRCGTVTRSTAMPTPSDSQSSAQKRSSASASGRSP